jgi:hypothetical protein
MQVMFRQEWHIHVLNHHVVWEEANDYVGSCRLIESNCAVGTSSLTLLDGGDKDIGGEKGFPSESSFYTICCLVWFLRRLVSLKIECQCGDDFLRRYRNTNKNKKGVRR